MEFNDILRLMSDKKASDLFITVGRPPCLKVDDHIKPIAKTALSADQTRELAFGLMSPEQREEFKRCQPWRAKRRLVDPSSREAALLTRRAHSARGEAK